MLHDQKKPTNKPLGDSEMWGTLIPTERQQSCHFQTK